MKIPRVSIIPVRPYGYFSRPSESERRELSYYEKEIQRPLLSKSEEKKYLEESPLVKKYVQKAKKLQKKLKDTNASKKTILRETKKIKDEFYKQLIKKHSKEKQKISRLRKEMEEFGNIKLRTLELIRTAKQRKLTYKEIQELKRMSSKMDRLNKK